MGLLPEALFKGESELPRSAATCEFQLPRLERVISGADSVNALAAELDRRRLTRAVIVTGRTLGASTLLTRVSHPLGDWCRSIFRDARQHVPSGSVADLARVLEQQHADCVISFGGGSPIDTVKAAIHILLTAGEEASTPVDGPVHIAIPTTLSAGEFTSVVGITDEETRVKRAVSDPRLCPRTVYIDPTMTLETPQWLWAASGVRALDHAVETIYSARRHPLSEAAASRGLSMLLEHLPASRVQDEEQVEHRLQCQLGAWLSVFGIGNAGLGLSHALGHQIGPRWNVAHGVTSCITLPHAMRFMAEAAPERFGPIARAFGIVFETAKAREAALECADRMAQFITQFNLPQRLRDVNVPQAEIREVAGVVHDILERAHGGDGSIGREQVESVLAAAY